MFDFFRRWFGWMWSGLVRVLEYIGGALASFAEWLLQLLRPLWDFLGGLLYLLGQLIEVVWLVLKVFLLFVQWVLALAGGLIRTLSDLLTFDPATITPTNNPYATGSQLFLEQLGRAGGDVFAQVLTWGLWLMFAWAVLSLFAGARPESAD